MLLKNMMFDLLNMSRTLARLRLAPSPCPAARPTDRVAPRSGTGGGAEAGLRRALLAAAEAGRLCKAGRGRAWGRDGRFAEHAPLPIERFRHAGRNRALQGRAAAQQAALQLRF